MALTWGLSIGVIFGKDSTNFDDKPLFIDAFMLTILHKPSSERCSFLLNNSTANLNNSKSARFWVSKGYLSKWGIILLAKSLIERTT